MPFVLSPMTRNNAGCDESTCQCQAFLTFSDYILDQLTISSRLSSTLVRACRQRPWNRQPKRSHVSITSQSFLKKNGRIAYFHWKNSPNSFTSASTCIRAGTLVAELCSTNTIVFNNGRAVGEKLKWSRLRIDFHKKYHLRWCRRCRNDDTLMQSIPKRSMLKVSFLCVLQHIFPIS